MAQNQHEDALLQGQDDPYRNTIEGMRRREQSRLSQSLKASAAKQPDRQAEVLKLSERTRLPSSFVDRNFDEISKRYPAPEVDTSQLVRDTPTTAQWLAEPANAALAKDDVPQLGYLDRMLQYGENAFRSVAAAIPATSASIYRIGQAGAELTEKLTGPVNDALGAGDFKHAVSQWFDRQAAGLETQAANVAPDPERTGPLERDVYSGIQSTAQNLLLLPLSLMSGGATATVGAMGTITGGQSYGKLRSQNVGVYRSLLSAGADGLIEAGTEMIPTTIWLKELSLHTGFSKTLMRSLAAELPGEQAATVLQDLNAWGNLPENAEKTLGDYARERPEAAVHTLIATLVGTAGQVGITRAVDRAVTGKPSQQLFFEQLGKGLTESKTFARLPEKVQELIAAATKNGAVENVYAPIETFKTYWQDQGADPKAVARELLGSDQAYDQAVATGTDLEIPTALYAAKIAPTEHNAFFSRELRFDPEQMNAREEEEFEKAFQEEQKAAPADTAPQDSANRIREDIIGQMLDTGYTREAVETNAAAVAESFRVTAERFGVDPFALYEPYKLKINRPVPEILRSMPDIDVALDPMIDRLRAGSLPTQTEMLGTSLLEFLREKGGVLDDGGDLASREPDADLKPFQRKLIQEGGLPLDRAREAAAEAGYLDKQSSIADFLDVIEKELRGEPVFAQGQENAQAIEQHTVLEQLGGYLKSRDVDISTATNAEIKQLLQDAAEAPAIDARTGTVLDQAGEAIVVLTGNELGEIGDKTKFSIKQAAKLGMEYYERELRGTSAVRAELPEPVRFSNAALGKVFHRANRTKLQLLPAVSAIIERGDYLGREENHNPDQPDIRAYHRFSGVVQIGEGKVIGKVLIFEDQNGHFFYDVNYDMEKAQNNRPKKGPRPEPSDGSGLEAQTPDPESGKTTLNQSIGLEPDNINLQVTPVDNKRGRILFAPSRRAFAGPITIELLEKADLSTFLHEFGHFYLEMFGDIADELRTRPHELTDTQRRMVEDYDAALKWLGVESRDAIGEEQHEQWARGFEAYLWEGKVPNPKLRSIFSRVSSWLKTVYESLLKLRVNLTPEVRGVMDRLLATDEQITQAEKEAGILAKIESRETAERLGMTAKEFALHRDDIQETSDAAKESLQKQFIAEYTRASEGWFQARRKEVRSDVAAGVHQQKIYVALAFLQKGTLADGSPLPEGIEAFKLDADKLDARYEKAVRRDLRTEQNPGPRVTNKLLDLRVYARENGVDPDQAAELLGYSSGDELVQALMKTRNPEALIEAETSRLMDESYGNMLTDGTAAEKAKDAVMTEGRSELIQKEMKRMQAAVRKAAPYVASGKEEQQKSDRADRAAGMRDIRTFIPSVAFARSIAERRIADMRVKDIRPGLYFSAARRESLKAVEAANKADFAGALQSMQTELLSVEMYRAAVNAQKRIENTRQYMTSFDKKSTRERIGKAGEDYLDQIDALRDRFQFSKITEKANQRRKTLAAWVADQEAKGLPVDVPAELLDESRQVNYRDATIQELAGLRDTIEHIASLARLKNELLTGQRKMTFDAEANGLQASIDGNRKGPRKIRFSTRLPQDKLARAAAQAFAAHRKLNSFFREMDGWVDGGPMWEAFMRRINQAQDAEASRNVVATTALADIFDRHYKGEERKFYQKTYVPQVNGSVAKMESLMVALNWGNTDNRQRIIGGGFGDSGPIVEAQAHAVLNLLDERDWTFVEEVWDHIDSYWPEIAAKQKRVTGVAPEKVEASSFVNKFGRTLRGGYFPIKYEGQISAKASGDLGSEFADSIKQASYAKATTRRGHTQERVQNVKQPVRLDFGVITEHVQQVIHDLTHHEMLIDVGRLLADERVSRAIYDFYGNDIVRDEIKGAIKDIALGTPAAGQWMTGLNYLRRGVVTAQLAWSVTTSFLQPLGLVNGAIRVGPKWFARGALRWARNATSLNSSVHWIQERSGMMRERGRTQFRELNEVKNKIGLNQGVISGWMHDALAKLGVDPSRMPVIADSFFYMIQKAQQIADVPTWLGAYEKAMADPRNDEDRAVALADQAVIDSQGSGMTKDLSSVEREPKLKILTTFYTYPNVVFGQVYESVKARRLLDAAILIALLPALEFALREVLRGDDDDDWPTLAKKLARHELAGVAGMFVGVRELSGPIEGYSYQGPAGLRWVPVTGRALQQALQGEADATFWKAQNELAGVFFHKPAAQIEKTAEGLLYLADGKTKNPTVLFFGAPKD